MPPLEAYGVGLPDGDMPGQFIPNQGHVHPTSNMYHVPPMASYMAFGSPVKEAQAASMGYGE